MLSWAFFGRKLSPFTRLFCLAYAIAACQTGGTHREALWSADRFPDGVAACSRRLDQSYRLGFLAEPFYLRGDFDADGREDIVLRVERVLGADVVVGVAFCLSSNSRNIWIVGAGREIPYFHESYEEEEEKIRNLVFDAWWIFDKTSAQDAIDWYAEESAEYRGKYPRFVGDVLGISLTEEHAFLLYWDGRQFRLLRHYFC